MQPVLVYALYAWIALSVLALVIHQVRRVRGRRRLVEPGTSLDRSLAGFRPPCDLQPVAPRGMPIADDTMVLATATTPAEVVGPAVADEFERLGYALEPSSPSTLVARRGTDLLYLEMILAPGAHAEQDGRPSVDLDEGSVLVRISLG